MAENSVTNTSDLVMFKGVYLPEAYKYFADVIEDLEVRDDDVWVCSFPKAGTTWTQEMVWCISNNLDFEGAKVNITDRFPFLEVATLIDENKMREQYENFELSPSEQRSVQFVQQMRSPRFIKTHLPFHLLPHDLREGKTKAKIIYISRDPKDTCISFWHHYKIMDGYTGSLEEFCKLFLEDKIMYCPFWNHAIGYWNQRKNSKLQILFLKFEEMKTNLASVIMKTTKFLEKPPLSPPQLELLVDHLSFTKMKENQAVNYEEYIKSMGKNSASKEDGSFIRCGETNQWKVAMPCATVEKFDECTARYQKSGDFIF